MRIIMFYHSLVSDWNHGNAHFLRGVVGELQDRGHDIVVYEPWDGWSYRNLIREYGIEPIREFHTYYPALSSNQYQVDSLDLDHVCESADAVLVHEWNTPELIARLGAHRRRTGKYKLLFHDTHHRAVSDPAAISSDYLRDYDGALVFGDSLRKKYLNRGWPDTVWVWHEAADTKIFKPRRGSERTGDVAWIGNWGDGERSAELKTFLLDPVRVASLKAKIFGVRYPPAALQALIEAGAEYGGWLPNFRVPEVFGQFLMTVHIPRAPYRDVLPGIPTIRVFEALACGIPLICSPWVDCEHLFTPGKDYLIARNGPEMTEMMKTLAGDAGMRRELSEHGLTTISERHTCRHRVDQLLEIIRK